MTTAPRPRNRLPAQVRELRDSVRVASSSPLVTPTARAALALMVDCIEELAAQVQQLQQAAAAREVAQ